MSSRIILQSAGVARVLLWLLRVALLFTGFSTFLTIINHTLPASRSTIVALQNLLNLFAIPFIFISLAILMLSLVWIYRLHDDLHKCYSHYPIDSWDALWSFIFIIFIWKTLMTIARHFQTEIGRLHHYGIRLSRLVPTIYSIFMTSYLLERLIYRYDYLDRPISFRNIPEFIIPVVIIAKEILELAGVFVLLIIAQTIVNAMRLKVHQINSQTTS